MENRLGINIVDNLRNSRTETLPRTLTHSRTQTHTQREAHCDNFLALTQLNCSTTVKRPRPSARTGERERGKWRRKRILYGILGIYL